MHHLIKRHPDINPNDIPFGKTQRTSYLTNTLYLNSELHQNRHLLSGLRIAIVGDLMSTGATFEASARILKDNGARWICNWVILKTRQVERI